MDAIEMDSREFSIWKLANTKSLDEMGEDLKAAILSLDWNPHIENVLILSAHYCNDEGYYFGMVSSLHVFSKRLSKEKINSMVDNAKKEDFEPVKGNLPTKFDCVIMRGKKNLFSLR